MSRTWSDQRRLEDIDQVLFDLLAEARFEGGKGAKVNRAAQQIGQMVLQGDVGA
jgi:hypothetical protein